MATSSANADPVDDWVAERMAKDHFPGMVVAVYRHGQPEKIGCYGFADLEHRVPLHRDSVFEICSVTKQFTAAAILLLVEDGKMQLDDPIAKYIPTITETWSGVTVRRLLNHTAGISDEVQLLQSTRPWTELLSELTKVVPSPGIRWDYSNNGYVLLGRAIEKASGLGYFEFLHDRIFRPLGMKNTGPNEPTTIIPNRVHGYVWDGKLYHNSEMLTDDVGFAAGGLVSTVDDLNIWSEALKTGALLKSSSRQTMLTAGQLASGDVAWNPMAPGYGMGVFLGGGDKHRIEKHSGGWADASVQLTRLLDDDVTIVVLSNLGGWAQRPFVGESLARVVIKDFPAAERPRPINDPHPSWTKNVALALAEIAKGGSPNELLTPRMQKLLSKARGPLQNEFKDFKSNVPATIIQSIKQGPITIQIYQIRLEEPKLLVVSFDAEGRLDDFSIEPVPLP